MATNDALGNPVVEGNWYGYSKESNGITRVIRARVKYLKNDKARLTDCREYLSLGITNSAEIVPTQVEDRTMTCHTLFPIPPQE